MAYGQFIVLLYNEDTKHRRIAPRLVGFGLSKEFIVTRTSIYSGLSF